MSKKILFLFFSLFIFIGCDGQKSSVGNFGKKITEKNTITVDQLMVKMKNGSSNTSSIKVKGKINSVCKNKGCWMTLISSSGEELRVTFKDYSFFVPKNCDGKTAIIEGIASQEELSVAMQKEYAKDDGKSKSEIDSINKPKVEYSFEAIGVIIK